MFGSGYRHPCWSSTAEQARIISVELAHRIVADLGDRETVRLEPDGNHSWNNLATVALPEFADWVTDRLEDVT